MDPYLTQASNTTVSRRRERRENIHPPIGIKHLSHGDGFEKIPLITIILSKRGKKEKENKKRRRKRRSHQDENQRTTSIMILSPLTVVTWKNQTIWLIKNNKRKRELKGGEW